MLIPFVVVLVVGLVLLALRFFWNLRSNKELVARLGEFVTLPAEERAAERRKEVDHLLAVAGDKKKRKRSFRWTEGFAEDVDVCRVFEADDDGDVDDNCDSSDALRFQFGAWFFF